MARSKLRDATAATTASRQRDASNSVPLRQEWRAFFHALDSLAGGEPCLIGRSGFVNASAHAC